MNKLWILLFFAAAAMSTITTGCSGGNPTQRHTGLVPGLYDSTTYDGTRPAVDKCSRVALEQSAIDCQKNDDTCGPDVLTLQTSIENVPIGGSCATLCPGCERSGGDCIHLNGGRCICG